MTRSRSNRLALLGLFVIAAAAMWGALRTVSTASESESQRDELDTERRDEHVLSPPSPRTESAADQSASAAAESNTRAAAHDVNDGRYRLELTVVNELQLPVTDLELAFSVVPLAGIKIAGELGGMTLESFDPSGPLSHAGRTLEEQAQIEKAISASISHRMCDRAGRIVVTTSAPSRVQVAMVPRGTFDGPHRYLLDEYECELTEINPVTVMSVSVRTMRDVTGRVRLANGAIDSTSHVSFFSRDGAKADLGESYVASLDGEGRFTQPLVAGEYFFVAKGGAHNAMEEGLVRAIEIAPVGPTEFDEQLSPNSRIWMTVVDSSGEPVPRVGIRLTQVEPFAGEWNANSTDHRGWVEFYGILPGTYSVALTGGGSLVDEVPDVVVGEGIAAVNAGQLVYAASSAGLGTSAPVGESR